MEDVILWLIVGLIAGGMASFLVPGRAPGGALPAIIVGMLGGVFGGWTLDALDVGPNLTWLGALCAATVAALALLHTMRSVDRTSRI
jgi:uncharacterized membrane protein YeaQ/YmgE (transglycosylase-associated protein family)